MTEIYTEQQVREKFRAALDELLQNDGFLLEGNVHERSVCHKLAEYLQGAFGSERHVDCEYNRHGRETKRLDGLLADAPECSEQRSTERILPDVIVHVRNTDEFNTLVIEVKTGDGSSACDIRKLELLTSPRSEYRYQCGAFIKFNGIRQPEIDWFPRN